MVNWKTITIDKDGTYHQIKYTTDDVHINRKLGTGNNNSAWLNRMKKDQRELIKVDKEISKLEKNRPSRDVFEKRGEKWQDWFIPLEYYLNIRRLKRHKIEAIKRHLSITTPNDWSDDESEWSTLGNNAGEEETFRRRIGTKPLPSYEWGELDKSENKYHIAYQNIMNRRKSKGQRKKVKVKRRSRQNVPAEVEAAEKALLDVELGKFYPIGDDEETALLNQALNLSNQKYEPPAMLAASPSSSVINRPSDVEPVPTGLDTSSTESLGGRKKKTRRKRKTKKRKKKRRRKSRKKAGHYLLGGGI